MNHSIQKALSLLFIAFFTPLFSVAQTQINDSLTIAALVDDFFNSGVLVNISNITFNGMPPDSSNSQIGLFSNGTADSLNMDMGMVISSGAVINIVDQTTFVPFDEYVEYTDPDLAAIAGADVFRCAVLEFDVEVNADALAFSYFFGSLEYSAFTCSLFNDAFGLFISGPGIDGPYQNNAINIATIPGSDIPVAINTVNSGTPSFSGNATICASANPNWQEDAQYFIDNESNQVSSIWFPGYTQNFEAYSEVQNGETYHIKLAVSNTNDAQLPSGVFFEAGSFEGRLLSNVPENEAPDFNLYPNPATSTLYLKNTCNTCGGETEITITDIGGRKVAQLNPGSSHLIPIDISQLDRGIYFVSLRNDGRYLGTKKLVLE